MLKLAARSRSTWVSTEVDFLNLILVRLSAFVLRYHISYHHLSKITAFFKRPSTHAADNDDISPENAKPPNKKASKSGSRENTTFLKTVLHWKKDFTVDLGYKLSKQEGQSEVVEEIWCETCRKFSSDRSSSVGDYNICRVILKLCVCYDSKIIIFIFQMKAVLTSESSWDNQHFESCLHTHKI